jgi:hypothetical protein
LESSLAKPNSFAAEYNSFLTEPNSLVLPSATEKSLEKSSAALQRFIILLFAA